MNDADLERLNIKPGSLSPTFNRNITEYDVILGSSTKQITITPVTRDTSSSWTIVGYGTTRQIPLNEGETKKVIIEVTAEDGTEKQYTINVVVISASDASLSGIKVPCGTLTPNFNQNVLEYDVNLPWHLETVKVLPEARDKEIIGANEYVEVSLNYGGTCKVIETVSPNKMSCKRYQMNFIKDRILRLVTPVSYNKAFHCSICLGEIHCAVSFKREDTSKSEKMTSCRACMDMITRTRKIDPFTDVPLSSDFMLVEKDIDSELSSIIVFCCYKSNGCEVSMKLSNMGNHMSSCEFKPLLDQQHERVTTQNLADKLKKISIAVCDVCSRSVCNDDLSTHKELYCPAKRTNTVFNHVVELHDWEKALQQKCNMDTVDITSDIEVNQKDDIMKLDLVATKYAGMIKMKPRDALNHFRLGTVLEEMFYAQDIWGDKKTEPEKEEDDFLGEDLMDIEIRAICKARGVDENAELSQILKALDEEYRHLLLEKQSAKADYLQNLYSWKSKQSLEKTNKPHTEAVDEILERAFLKFLDASTCDPSNSLYHIHIGRLLLLKQKYKDATERLEAAIGLKPTSIEARFYLGLAYAKYYSKRDRPADRIMNYLQEGVDYILYMLFEGAATQPQICSTNTFVRHSNVLILEGMLELATILSEKESPTEKEKDKVVGMFRETSKLCIEILCNIKHKKSTYRQLQWITLRAQFSLCKIETQLANSFKDKEDAVKHWGRLAALSKAFELPNTSDLLRMQKDMWEEAVMLIPSNSHALYRLGDAQLALYDYMVKGSDSHGDEKDNGVMYLEEAQKSYRTSIQFEGKSISENEQPSLINDSIWWKKRHENSQKRSVNLQPKTESKLQPQKNEKAVKTTSRASTVVKRDQTKAGRPVQTKTPLTSTSKGGGATNSSRKTVAPKTGSNMSGVSKKSSGQKLTKSVSTHHTGCTTSKKPLKESTVDGSKTADANKQDDKELKRQMSKIEEKSDIQHEKKKDSVVLNAVNYQSRLGLARVLSRLQNTCHWTEVVELYQEVMHLAPDVHDSYIELGELLSQKEPTKAIEVYIKYPFKNDGNFDDAYLYEEIIRLLVKTEDFDNPCLQSSMIGYGKIMGLSTLEKTVSILEEKMKFDVLMRVYAEVNNKDISDQDLQAFFKFKCWT